jgi:predicted flap endonuclease-1-like 5' DNA nuclease
MYVILQNLIYLILAAILGGLFAWLIGLCRCRNAGDLDAVRKERDDLQSRLTAANAAPAPVARDDGRVASLEAELAEARVTADRQAAELARLRADADGPRADDEGAAAMKWRNRYLEARVKFLEDGAAAAPVAAGLAGAAVGAAVAGGDRAKASEGEPDNASFTPSPLVNASPADLEQMILAAGEGRKPKATRKRANPDNLLDIDGVGPVNNAFLNENGIRYFWQIATMDADELAWIANNLPSFGSRVYRENWVRQCVNLAAGRAARDNG